MHEFSKIFITLSVSCLLLTSCAIQSNDVSKSNEETISDTSMDESSDYKEYYKAVSNFQRLGPLNLENSDFSKPSFIYFGRVTCPYCRKFVPVLKKISENNNISINYIDTEEISDSVLDSFDINEVPTLVYINQEGIQFKYDSNTKRSLDMWIAETND